MDHARSSAGIGRRQGQSDTPRDWLVAERGRNLRHTGRRGRLGMAGARLDADPYPPFRLSIVVVALFGAALSADPRHMVLLDAPVDAPSGAVPPLPRGTPPEPPAPRLAGDELSPMGKPCRGNRHSAT